jgi:hypothetical protein
MVAVGTLVYAIVAQVLDSPLEPARTFMRWQSLWNDGYYGVKYNFAVTWISMLVALGGPPALIGLTVEAIRSACGRPVFPSDWRALQWKHMDRAARLRLALGLAGIALLFGGVCIVDASLLTPVGFLAQLLLLVWPFTVIGGAVLVLDELLPEQIVIGPIEALGRAPHGQSEQFHVKVAGKHITVPADLWSQLAASDTIAVRTSGLDRVRAVAVRP